LSFIQGLAVDTVTNELFVANGGSNSITVYSPTAGRPTAIRPPSGPSRGRPQG
jgi:DNA-binding beta-propeller fold protein YncE